MGVVAAVTLFNDQKTVVVRWPTMANGDTGGWVQVPWAGDKSMTARGTFGAGGSVALYGSNEIAAAPTMATLPLNDPQGNVIAVTSTNQIEQVLEHTYQVSPKVTAGDGTTSLTVEMIFTKTTR